MKKKVLSIFTTLAVLFSLVSIMPIMEADAAGLTLSELKAKFPDGKYWNHVVYEYNQYGDVLMKNWNDSTADSVTDGPCATHNGAPAYGSKDCNVFAGSMQCCGFAKKLAYDAYGEYNITSNWGKVSFSNAKPGDVIHYYRSKYPYNTPSNFGHWAMIIGINGNTMTFGEANVDKNCLIKWGRQQDIGGVDSYTIYSAPYRLTDHQHSYSNSITKQPTCTEQGVRTFTCSCGNSYTEAIAATGHSYANKIVPPTSSDKGYTLHTCTKCGHSYKDSYIDQIKDESYTYVSKLPDNITSDKYIIEYKNTYNKVSKSSPGNEWTQGSIAKSEYENSGSPFETAKYVETSDKCVMTSYYYYHYCGRNAGNEANYEMWDKFNHYDSLSSGYSVVVKQTGMDGEYPWFVLGWANDNSTVYCGSGVTCDGSYGTHGAHSKAWYRMATYQNKALVNYYNYSKTSDWVTSPDSNASSVQYRYKAKPEPAITTVTTTKVTTTTKTTSTTTAAAKLGTVKNIKVDKNGKVTWSAANGAVAYKVGKVVNGKTTYSGKITGTSYKFKNVPKNDYKVLVVAFSANGTKTYSSKVFVPVNTKPTNVKVSSNGKSVSWTAAAGAVKYQVVKIVGGKMYKGTKVTKTSYNFSNAVKSGTMVYVIAYDSNGKTHNSDIITVK